VVREMRNRVMTRIDRLINSLTKNGHADLGTM
jgi:hypothetical protein